MKVDKIVENLFADYIDRIIYRFWDDPNSVFPKNNKTKVLFDNLKSTIKNNKRRRICLVQDCKLETVRKSHCISKKLFLQRIAENSMVLTPAFDYSKGKLILQQKGINEASTFPGYCENHEKLFLDFEKNGEFKNESHVNLQLFRTICREYYVKIFRKETLLLLLNDYLTNRDTSFLHAYKADPFGQLLEIKGMSIKSFSYSGRDEIESQINVQLRKIEKEIYEINQYYELCHGLLQNNDDFYTYGYIVDIEIPICLSGRANLHFNENGSFKNIIVFINILPTKNETFLTISSFKENEKYINQYLGKIIYNSESVINMIETWMVRGSDHWFIKPSIWNNLDETKRTKILADIHDIKYNIGTPYSIPIFIDLRKQINKSVNKPVKPMLMSVFCLLNVLMARGFTGKTLCANL